MREEFEKFKEWCGNVGGEVEAISSWGGEGLECTVPLEGTRKAKVIFWHNNISNAYVVSVESLPPETERKSVGTVIDTWLSDKASVEVHKNAFAVRAEEGPQRKLVVSVSDLGASKEVEVLTDNFKFTLWKPYKTKKSYGTLSILSFLGQ